ncbi:MAG: NADH-quinone oxidoreductase subunit N [Pseudomonadota bacterium]|nr:NADH-quinone oxidoreductase subunit N [Pseudomonadota bacterium]
MLLTTDFFAIIPEMLLLLGICVSILFRLFSQSSMAVNVYYSSQLSCAITFLACAAVFYRGDFGIYFNGLWELDNFAIVIKAFLVLGLMVLNCYARGFVLSLGDIVGDYYLLLLLSLLGMFVLPSASNLLIVFLGVELMSLPIYALVALWRDKPACVEAALKYFVTGALASCLLLYGFSLIYGATGALAFTDIKMSLLLSNDLSGYLVPLAIVFIVSGFAFKLSLVPFHMWAPDVYEGAPLPVTMLIATLPKIAVFSVLIRLFTFALSPFSFLWSKIFIIISIFSIVVGNTLALTQHNLRRLLAYSSIAHMGYMLLGIVVVDNGGYAASMFYMFIYVLTNLAVFGAILSIGYKKGYIEKISDFTGLHYFYPGISFLIMLMLFSLAGVPPIVGFMAKLAIFDALIKSNLTYLATIAILFTLLGAFYYIKIIKFSYFEEESGSRFEILATHAGIALLFLNVFTLIIVGLFPAQLLKLSHNLTLMF